MREDPGGRGYGGGNCKGIAKVRATIQGIKVERRVKGEGGEG